MSLLTREENDLLKNCIYTRRQSLNIVLSPVCLWSLEPPTYSFYAKMIFHFEYIICIIVGTNIIGGYRKCEKAWRSLVKQNGTPKSESK